MKKITEKAKYAWCNRINFKESNTRIVIDEHGSRLLYLFDNLIAWDIVNGNNKPIGEIGWTLNGWNTITTRERLNGILDITIKTQQGTPYVFVQGNGFVPISKDMCYTRLENGLVIV